MADIEFEIDGKLVNANQGDSIISIADREGIDVPRFCYHKKLSVAANCVQQILKVILKHNLLALLLQQMV